MFESILGNEYPDFLRKKEFEKYLASNFNNLPTNMSSKLNVDFFE